MNNKNTVYLVHHNQPQLLEAQIHMVKDLLPDAEIVVGLTCHLRKANHRAPEMFQIAKLNDVRIIESDTGRKLINRIVQFTFSKFPLRSIVLRAPFFRKYLGQDASSGHARLLNKIWGDVKQPKGNQIVWLIEGDVFPIGKIHPLPDSTWVEGITEFSEINGRKIEYLNPRLIRFRTTPEFLSYLSNTKFDWSPLHTFKYWRDTGSRTHKIVQELRAKGKVNVLTSFRSGQWFFSDDVFQSIKSANIKKALQSDPRNIPGSISCDFYGDTWVHIGKMSGYHNEQPQLFNELVLEVLKPIWSTRRN